MEFLKRILAEHATIGLDTSIFIYHFEVHPLYLPASTMILNGVQNGEWHGVTSMVTLMEITVKPRQLGREDVARHYEALLANFPNLSLVDVNRDIARKAAELRAKHKIRPADAFQIATAIVQDASIWVTNDKRLKNFTSQIKIAILDDYI